MYKCQNDKLLQGPISTFYKSGFLRYFNIVPVAKDVVLQQTEPRRNSAN